METTEIYEVFYKDDKRTRHKTLEFLKVKDGLAVFNNLITGREENIPVTKIVRTEGVKRNLLKK